MPPFDRSDRASPWQEFGLLLLFVAEAAVVSGGIVLTAWWLS